MNKRLILFKNYFCKGKGYKTFTLRISNVSMGNTNLCRRKMLPTPCGLGGPALSKNTCFCVMEVAFTDCLSAPEE